jgi:type I restriction enzyme S subunit
MGRMRIRDLVTVFERRNPPSNAVVFSVSEKLGVVPQDQLFAKKIALDNKTAYLQIEWGDIVYNPYLLWNRAVGVCFDKCGGCVSPAYVVLRPRVHDIERFLHYFLRSKVFTGAVDAIASGSVTRRRTARVEEILDLEFDLPPLPEQKAIHIILTFFDSKIELNRRMNETLEAMAQVIFKSWFVGFEPFRNQGMQRSPLGPIPLAWGVGKLGDIADNPRRGVQPNQIEGHIPYIGLEHMPRHCIALAEWGKADDVQSNKFEFKRGEILFGKLRPYFHKVGIASVNGVCSTDILVVTPKEPQWFGIVLGHISSDEFINYTDAASTGTKMPRTNWDDMSNYKVALPPKHLAETFTKRISPLLERILTSIFESRTLSSIRDALVPKLLSGQIRVKDAERLLREAI